MVFAPQWMVDYIDPAISRTRPTGSRRADLQWDDVAPFFRDFSATYNGKVYTIPFDGDFQMVYYRSDLLDQPASAAQDLGRLLEIAKAFHGKDLNGDGKAYYGSCIAKKRNAQSYWMSSRSPAASCSPRAPLRARLRHRRHEPLVQTRRSARRSTSTSRPPSTGLPTRSTSMSAIRAACSPRARRRRERGRARRRGSRGRPSARRPARPRRRAPWSSSAQRLQRPPVDPAQRPQGGAYTTPPRAGPSARACARARGHTPPPSPPRRATIGSTGRASDGCKPSRRRSSSTRPRAAAPRWRAPSPPTPSHRRRARARCSARG